MPDDPQGRLVVTSTSLKTFRSCSRKWYLGYVHGIREERKSVFTLGSVLHACCERFLLAGPDQIVPSVEDAMKMTWDDPFEEGGPLHGQTPGDAIDIFPEGYWHLVYERDGSVARMDNPLDQELVEHLVKEGIRNGTVHHGEGLEVEKLFFRDLAEGTVYRSLTDWRFMEPGSIRVKDHKSVHSRRYALKPDRLAKDPQLLSYGYDALMTSRERGWEDPPYIELGHSQFLKKEREVEYTCASPRVTPKAIEKNWEKMVDDSARMLQYVENRPDDPIEDVQGPKKGSNACKDYGGCPFLKYCRKQEPLPPPKDMDKPTPVPNASSLPDLDWTNPDCAYCSGKGVDANNDPCGQCLGHYVAEGGPNPVSFALSYNAETKAQEARIVYESSHVEGAPDDTMYLGRTIIKREDGTSADIAFPLQNSAWPEEENKAAWTTNPFSVTQILPETTPSETSEPEATESPKVSEKSSTPPSARSGRVPRSESKGAMASDAKKTTAPTPSLKTETKSSPSSSKKAPKEDSSMESKSTENARSMTTPMPESEAPFTVLVGQSIGVQGMGTVIEFASILPQLQDMVAQAFNQESYWDCDPFRRRDSMTGLVDQVVSGCKGGGVLVIRDTQSPETRDLITLLIGKADIRITS